jgi:hypothetical protein
MIFLVTFFVLFGFSSFQSIFELSTASAG